MISQSHSSPEVWDMLSVTPILMQLKRSAGKQDAGRGFGCPALPVPWPAPDRDMSPGPLPWDMFQHREPRPTHSRLAMDGAPWLGRLTGPKTSKGALLVHEAGCM